MFENKKDAMNGIDTIVEIRSLSELDEMLRSFMGSGEKVFSLMILKTQQDTI
jgi:hypothetical protein